MSPSNMSVLSLLFGAAALANAHGYFVSPVARQPGDAFSAACGQQADNMMSSDINGNIQGLTQLTSNQADFNAEECDLWLCKGMKYSDNVSQLQSYTPGQEVPMYFAIRAPHNGYANVSVVDTETNTILATLKTWDEYAMTSRPTVASEMNFTVTIPETLGDKCAVGGECVLQMHWNAESVDQTYQSCIDFTLGGAGTGGNGTGTVGNGTGTVGNGTDTVGNGTDTGADDTEESSCYERRDHARRWL